MKHRILISELLVVLATAGFAIFLPIYFSTLGFQPAEIGLAFGFLLLSASMVGFLLAIIQEKINIQPILKAAYAGYIFLPIFYISVSQFIHLVLVTAYDGIITACRFGPLYSLFEQRSGSRTTGSIAYLESASFFIAFIGPILAGVFSSLYSIPIYLWAASSLAALAFIIFPHRFSFPDIRRPSREIFSKLKFLKTDVVLHALLATMFILSFVQLSLLMVLSLLLYQEGYPVEIIGLVGGLFFLGIASSEYLAGRIETRTTRNRLFSFGLLLAAIAMVLFAFLATTFWSVVSFVLLFAVAIGLIRPAIFTFLVMNQSSYRYFTTNVLLVFSRWGGAIGLVIAGFLIGLDFLYYFLLAALLLFLAFILSFSLKHPRKR